MRMDKRKHHSDEIMFKILAILKFVSVNQLPHGSLIDGASKGSVKRKRLCLAFGALGHISH